MSLFPTIITKEILGRNAALINFVGRIQKGKMGVVKCTILAFQE
jgi:hypothetical protein